MRIVTKNQKQMKRAACFILLALVVLMFFSLDHVYAGHWYQYYLKGKQHYRDRNYSAAITALEKAVSLNAQPGPKRLYDLEMIDYTPYFLLGQSYYSIRKESEAATYYQKSLELGSWLPQLHHKNVRI